MTKFCPSCGSPVARGDAKFCSECGCTLEDDPGRLADAETAATNDQALDEPESLSYETGKKWGALTVAILVLLLVSSLVGNAFQYSQYHSGVQRIQELIDEKQRIDGQFQEANQELQIVKQELEDANQELQLLKEVPTGYYDSKEWGKHPNTLASLKQFLTFEFMLPREYEFGVFDCSESAAYMEWALHNAGFKANIAVGKTPWDQSSGGHAWVLVDLEEGRLAIESTKFTRDIGGYVNKIASVLTGSVPGAVFKDESTTAANYYAGYDNLYRNVYLAISDCGGVGEWDWWLGYWDL